MRLHGLGPGPCQPKAKRVEATRDKAEPQPEAVLNSPLPERRALTARALRLRGMGHGRAQTDCLQLVNLDAKLQLRDSANSSS